MCGAIGRVTDNSFVRALMNLLNIPFELPSDHNIRPNAQIPIAIGSDQGSHGVLANWWLFQTADQQGYTYDKRYKSFNTRKEKLYSNRLQDFNYHRCVIPASCFYEWQGHRYRIDAADSALAFGGLYKTWSNGPGQPLHYSCSIITLPPHPRFSHIHDKSFPLMLLSDEIQPWLDNSLHSPEYWQNTLQTQIRFDLQVTPVDKKDPSVAIGETNIIPADRKLIN